MIGAKGAVPGIAQAVPRFEPTAHANSAGAQAPDGVVASAGGAAPASSAEPADKITLNQAAAPGADAAGATDKTQGAGDSAPSAMGLNPDARPAADTQDRESREASERLQQAKTRIQMLQLRARTAAASGDTQEADRAAREAATVAREISQLAQQLARSRGSAGAGGDAASGAAEPTPNGRKARHEGGPDARTVAQGLLADAAPKAGVPNDSTDGFLAEARTLASQARSLMDLLDRVPDADPAAGADPAAQTDQAGQPKPGRWADLVAAEQALEQASEVPAQPRRKGPEPGTLIKLTV
jgi:hypothetical protein